MAMTLEGLAALLQFSDGLFPAGGFAHSFGLETYTQAGIVRDREGLRAFLVAHLEGSSGPADGVAVAVACRSAATEDLTSLIELGQRLDVMKCVPEFRAASLQMGRQTLRVATVVQGDPFLAELARTSEESQTPVHHPVAFGAVVGRSGIDAETAVLGFLYSTSALIVNAALRLIRLGQLDGQAVLASLRPVMARLASAAARAGVSDMWTFTPALDIAGIRHERLDLRLFRS